MAVACTPKQLRSNWEDWGCSEGGWIEMVSPGPPNRTRRRNRRCSFVAFAWFLMFAAFGFSRVQRASQLAGHAVRADQHSGVDGAAERHHLLEQTLEAALGHSQTQADQQQQQQPEGGAGALAPPAQSPPGVVEGAAGAQPQAKQQQQPPPPPLSPPEEVSNTERRLLDKRRRIRKLLLAEGQQGAYLAFCLAAKDEHDDIREWIDYHAAQGGGKFYIYDTGSNPPMSALLSDYVKSGLVEYRHLTNFPALVEQLWAATQHRYSPKWQQLLAYTLCLQEHGPKHQWLAFIDTDEFLLFTGNSSSSSSSTGSGTGSAPLEGLLQEYEQHGALAVNWRMFGSGGQDRRPEGGVLRAYTKCYAPEEEEHTHIKTIANTDYMLRPGGAHHAVFEEQHQAVNTLGQMVMGPRSEQPTQERLVLHHYVTRSKEDYERKMARGSGMGNTKTWAFWDRVQSRATLDCPEGRAVAEQLHLPFYPAAAARAAPASNATAAAAPLVAAAAAR